MYPKCPEHFNPWGDPYKWMEPVWDLQEEGCYPPLKCKYCGRIFPGEKSVKEQSSDVNDIPFG